MGRVVTSTLTCRFSDHGGPAARRSVVMMQTTHYTSREGSSRTGYTIRCLLKRQDLIALKILVLTMPLEDAASAKVSDVVGSM